MRPDGLYQVTYGTICAGFYIEKGKVKWCSPVLRRKFKFFLKIAKRIGD